MEINNFYTATVYEKGAEVIRMIQHPGRRARASARAWTCTSARHDGQAVTCDDFVAAMAEASGFDFDPVHSAGTARPARRNVTVRQQPYDAEWPSYTLTCTQANRRASDAAPYLIRSVSRCSPKTAPCWPAASACCN